MLAGKGGCNAPVLVPVMRAKLVLLLVLLVLVLRSEAFWRPLGASWGYLGGPGVLLGVLRAPGGPLWAVCVILGASWGPLGGVLEAPWGALGGYSGAMWGHFGVPWGRLGSLGGPLRFLGG